MMIFPRSRIVFHCKLPEVLEKYPILEAKTLRYNWFKQSAMQYKNIVAEQGTSEHIAGTVKCPGINSILKTGYVLTSWFDLTIRTGNNDSEFEYVIPTGIDAYLKKYNYDYKLINWFSANEPALKIPVPKNSLQTLIKIATPWTVSIPKDLCLLMMPMPYPDEPEFSAMHGLLEPGEFYDINAIIQIHKKPGELFIPAGTPLCQMIVVKKDEQHVIQQLQSKENWRSELKNRFKMCHRFVTRTEKTFNN